MTVYLDLVFLLNFGFDAILLFGVALILKRKTTFKKIIFASLMGSISILFLFIKTSNIILFFFKIFIALLMLILAFGFQNFKYTFKNLFYLYTISILLGGFLYLLKIEYTYSHDGLIFYSNGLEINFLILVIASPIIVYAYLKQIHEIKNCYSNYYHLVIYFKDGTTLKLTSYLDTGNNLYDPYQKRPIILVNHQKLPKSYDNMLLVPYDTLNNHGLLKCIQVDYIDIPGLGKTNNILIGLAHQEIKIDGIDALLHKKILEELQ